MVLEDIDFENFKVEADRAQQIRELVQRVKTENWIFDLKTLVSELGSGESADFAKTNAAAPSLPGFSPEVPAQVYRFVKNETDKWNFIEQGPELFAYLNNVCVLEATLLPKGNEFVILSVNEEHIQALVNLFDGDLKVAIKEARSKKSARAASFKAKFTAEN